jgi:hypothetical protein
VSLWPIPVAEGQRSRKTFNYGKPPWYTHLIVYQIIANIDQMLIDSEELEQLLVIGLCRQPEQQQVQDLQVAQIMSSLTATCALLSATHEGEYHTFLTSSCTTPYGSRLGNPRIPINDIHLPGK